MKTNNLFKILILTICFLCCGFHVMGKDTTLRFTWKEYFVATYSQNVITKNRVLGDYFYESSKPHALTGVELLDSNSISLNQCDLTYTAFNKVKTINEGDYNYNINYYPNQSQAISRLKENNTIISERLYTDKTFEIDNVSGTKYFYVYAYGQPIAVFIGQNDYTPYFIYTDHLGSIDVITDQTGTIVDSMSFDAWGNCRDYNDWSQVDNSIHLIDRGFTMHQHLDVFNLINMGGRVYDPTVGQFLSPDPYVQLPNNTQNLNRYSYCMNSPLTYVDPSGNSFILLAIVGAAILNIGMNHIAGNVNNTGDFLKYAAIGAASGAATYGITTGLAPFASGATSGLGAFARGANAGFAGGFTLGAGNAWGGGADFSSGLQSGLYSGIGGGISGGIVSGLTSLARYQSAMEIFRKGNSLLGIEEGSPVPKTDKFLIEAQEAWHPDAPMDKIELFTVENVPASTQSRMDAFGAPGATSPYAKGNYLTGKSNVYFNRNLAFISAKDLFYTMGHEFVHVSQFAALAGLSSSILTPDFYDMLDFHAYNYQNSLGGLSLNSFTKEEILGWSNTYSQFYSMDCPKFQWTYTASFKYPF